jgi:hypothetical protein
MYKIKKINKLEGQQKEMAVVVVVVYLTALFQ